MRLLTLKYGGIDKKRFMGKGDPDPAVVDHVLGILRVCLDYYEETLSSQAYLSGEVCHDYKQSSLSPRI